MAIAFVIVTADTGCAESVLNGLREIASVKEAYMVYGVYDIIAKIEADTLNELGEIVTGQIRRLDSIRSTPISIECM